MTGRGTGADNVLLLDLRGGYANTPRFVMICFAGMFSGLFSVCMLLNGFLKLHLL